MYTSLIPGQTFVTPDGEIVPLAPADAVIAERADTVTGAADEHPPSENVLVAVPAETPETIPDDDPAVAILVLLLLHKPELNEAVSVAVLPEHIVAEEGVIVIAVLKEEVEDALPFTIT